MPNIDSHTPLSLSLSLSRCHIHSITTHRGMSYTYCIHIQPLNNLCLSLLHPHTTFKQPMSVFILSKRMTGHTRKDKSNLEHFHYRACIPYKQHERDTNETSTFLLAKASNPVTVRSKPIAATHMVKIFTGIKHHICML